MAGAHGGSLGHLRQTGSVGHWLQQGNARRRIAAGKFGLHGFTRGQRQLDLLAGFDRFLGGDKEAVAPVEGARGAMVMRDKARQGWRGGRRDIGNGVGKGAEVEAAHINHLLSSVTQISRHNAAAGTRLTASRRPDWPCGQVAAPEAAPHI